MESNKYFEEIGKLKKINNTNNQRIQELEKNLMIMKKIESKQERKLMNQKY